ncbi:MAG: hypothetical protein HC837_04750 [Chloroflexaceae bacterium]|nr:hypothetical protein [Chloroflexaceae bacterium]
MLQIIRRIMVILLVAGLIGAGLYAFSLTPLAQAWVPSGEHHNERSETDDVDGDSPAWHAEAGHGRSGERGERGHNHAGMERGERGERGSLLDALPGVTRHMLLMTAVLMGVVLVGKAFHKRKAV